MKIVRKNTFETNSSSTHAISIPKKGEYKKGKQVNFKWGEFGWEYEVYYDTKSKASYLYTMLRYFDGEYILTNNKKDEYLEKIKQYLDEENIKYTFEEPSDDSWDNGYVDHGCDTPELLDLVTSSKEILLTYLFDERAYVSTGNDNSEGYYIPGIEMEYEIIDLDNYENMIKKHKEDSYLIFKGN